MQPGDWITVAGMVFGFALQGAGLLVAGAMAWGRVKGTLDSLTGSIKSLTKSVDKLDNKLDSTVERVARLEAKGERP